MKCVNHPDRDAVYRCTVCKKHYCAACVELIDNKPYCFDCLKGIVRKTRSEITKGLTLNLMVAAMIAVLIAVMSITLTPDLIDLFFKASRDLTAFTKITALQLQGLAYAVLLIAVAFGIFTTKAWSFYLGILLNALVLMIGIVGFVRGEVFGASKGECYLTTLANFPLSICTSLFIVFVMGPTILLIVILSSKKELVGRRI